MEIEYLRQIVDHLKKIEQNTAQTRWWVVFFGRIKVALVILGLVGWIAAILGLIAIGSFF